MTTQKQTLSNEDRNKIFAAMIETMNLIQKENKISYDLRYHDKIAKWEAHLEKLYKMIEVGYIF
jgi:hypothetical protein